MINKILFIVIVTIVNLYTNCTNYNNILVCRYLQFALIEKHCRAIVSDLLVIQVHCTLFHKTKQSTKRL